MIARRTGFSMLEMSVVLVIIAVVVSMGLNIGSNAVKGSEKMQTRERLNTIQMALNNYARINGYLPCPFSRTLTATDAAYGVERRNSTTSVTCDTDSGLIMATVSGASIYIGAVPVRNLGLPDTYASDAWGNKILYAVSVTHVGDPGSWSTVAGPITVRTGTPGVNDYAITTSRDAATPYNGPGPGAVFVVLSHGPDGKGAYPINGTTVAIACGSTANVDVQNCNDSDLVFYDNTYNAGQQVATFFDDYVVWQSNELDRAPKSDALPTGCTGSCEQWCALCVNAPTASTAYKICGRVVTSTSPCQSVCIYSYPTLAVPCP